MTFFSDSTEEWDVREYGVVDLTGVNERDRSRTEDRIEMGRVSWRVGELVTVPLFC